MSSPDLTSGMVMRVSAALLNDTERQLYTYAAQLPYLNMALRELQEIFELSEIPITDAKSTVINIPIGYDHISFNNSIYPTLPSNLIEPTDVYESEYGLDNFIRMTKVSSLDKNNIDNISSFGTYTWQSQEIRFNPSIRLNDIKIDYIRSLFTPSTSENSQLDIINGESFLEYRTASLCAEFIGENKVRADSLNNDAGIALDRSTGIGIKGRQNIIVRRRPFRSNYKRRSR